MNPDLSNAQGAPEPTSPVGAGPAPTPTPNQNPFITPEPAPMQNPAPAPNFVPAQEPTPMAPQPMQTAPLPPKKKNTTTIVLAVILVLLVIGCGVAAAIMFWPKGGNNSGSSSNNGGSTPTTPVTPDEPEVSEEVELTDQTIIADLKTKLGIAMGVSYEGNYANTHNIFQHDMVLLKDGDLNDDQKAFTAIPYENHTKWEEVPEEQKQAILNDSEYFEKIKSGFGISVDEIKNNFYGYTHNAAQVREKYKEIYGKELAKSSDIDISSSSSACGYYRYNSEYDIYFEYAGCGGMGNPRFYYINKYKKDDKNAYLYVSAGMEENEVYCDVALFDEEKPTEVCTKETEGNSQMINESNYSKFAQYKITFNKSEDGKYYFEKAESL